MNFTDKYKPKSLKEIEGYEKEVREVVDFLRKKPILLYGATGTGKTTLVQCLADDLNYELIELNASDFRNKEQINTIVGEALNQRSLFKKGKIILIDEVDGISGREDYGGVPALLALMQKTNYPIIMTANDPWDKKFTLIRQKSKMIEIKKVGSVICKVLKKICLIEGIKVDEKTLTEITAINNNDIRASLIDLELLSGNKIIKNEDLELLRDSPREREETIFSMIQLILKTKDPHTALNLLENYNLDYEELKSWLDENIALEYRNKEDLAKAYDTLSKADVFMGRIMRWQHWRFLVYINELLTAGIAISKKEPNTGFIKYKRPERFLNIWRFNMSNKENKDKAIEISKDLHLSIKRTIKEMPYMRFLQ
ncbi:MAG: replication factor C large subunit [Candidatus Nanoarchaeia archaeon]